MIILHECDDVFFALKDPGPLQDPDAFVARVEAANPADWRGPGQVGLGQVGLEYRGPKGEDWMFFSLVGEGRYQVFSQRRNGDKIFAVDPEGSPKFERTFLLGGSQMRITDAELIASKEAADAAMYFLSQHGLLRPTVHWRKDGKPYWPDFE